METTQGLMRKRPNLPKVERRLTERQQAFCVAMVTLRAAGKENATQACRDAGYKGNDNTLAKQGYQLLNNPRIQNRIKELAKQVNQAPTNSRFTRLMGARTVLGITSFLACANMDMVLDDEGRFDIKKARETGGIFAIKKVTEREVTTYYKDGTHVVRVYRSVELRDKNESLRLMGLHHNLWTGEYDPQEVDRILAKIAGIPVDQLPAHLSPEPIVEGEILGPPKGQ